MDVEYPGFGTIVVDGIRYGHDVVLDAGIVRARDKTPSRPLKQRHGHTPLTEAEDIPWSRPQLIIGTGHSGRLPILDEVRVAARDHGVEMVEVPTAKACVLLRDLDPAAVNAILHVTC